MEGMDKNEESYMRSSQLENSCCNGSDRTDKGGFQDSISNDIHARLPLDPFGMNVKLITGWIADFPEDGVDFIEDRAMMFGAHSGDMEIDEKSYPSCSFEGWMEKEFGDGSCGSGYLSFCNLEEFLSFSSSQDTRVAQPQTTECEEGTGICSSSGDGGGGAPPNEALYYALSYLGVRDLLSTEKVCKSLRSAVQDDNLLWRSIHIDPPLSSRIEDDALIQLTNRAKGNLQCLSLVSCVRITNDGLSRVLENNPRLKKLSVPGCTRLIVDGIVNDLKVLKSSGAPGLMHLRLGRRYDVTVNHFNELKLLLTADKVMLPKAHKPRFFHDDLPSFSCDDGREFDIEMCPRCSNSLRFVYDCPSKGCQGKPCRACSFCIARCFQCGNCIIDNEYEETFCLDMLCVECWKSLFQCPEKQEESGSPFEHNIFYQGTTYHLRLFG